MSSLRFAFARLALPLLAAGALLQGGCSTSVPLKSETLPRTEAAPAAPPEDGDPSSAKKAYARRHFIQGLTRARLDDSAGAVTHYEEALKAAPQAPAILSALADALAAQGDLSTAIYHAELARQFGTATAHYHHQLARLYRRTEQPEKALQAYEQLLKHFPDDTEGRLALARLRAEMDRPAAALRAYRALAEHAGRAPAVLEEMLALYRKVGDAEGIEQSLQALIQQEPQKSEHRRALGRFYQHHARPQAALSLLEEALRQNPSDAETASLLADAYRTAGRPEDAAVLEERALTDAASATADQLVERARPLYHRAVEGETRDEEAASTATRLLEQALEKDAAHAEALALLGRLRYRAGAFAEAADLLARSLEENPRAPRRWSRAADAYLKTGQPERAAAVADEGLLLFPGQLPLLRARATALMRTGQHAAAARRLEEALRVMKADGLLKKAKYAAQAARFHSTLGRLYERQGQPEQARRHYERARALRDRLGTTAAN